MSQLSICASDSLSSACPASAGTAAMSAPAVIAPDV